MRLYLLDRQAFDWLEANYPLINIETGEPVEFGRESVAYIARREEWAFSGAPGEPHLDTKRPEPVCPACGCVETGGLENIRPGCHCVCHD